MPGAPVLFRCAVWPFLLLAAALRGLRSTVRSLGHSSASGWQPERALRVVGTGNACHRSRLFLSRATSVIGDPSKSGPTRGFENWRRKKGAQPVPYAGVVRAARIAAPRPSRAARGARRVQI